MAKTALTVVIAASLVVFGLRRVFSSLRTHVYEFDSHTLPANLFRINCLTCEFRSQLELLFRLAAMVSGLHRVTLALSSATRFSEEGPP